MNISHSIMKVSQVMCLKTNYVKIFQNYCLRRNLEILRNGLSGKKEIRPVEGVNHLFQHCKTGDPLEYKDIEETFAPEVIAIIISWLKGL